MMRANNMSVMPGWQLAFEESTEKENIPKFVLSANLELSLNMTARVAAINLNKGEGQSLASYKVFMRTQKEL